MRLVSASALALVAFTASPTDTFAQDFYRGKTITFILGSSPGGGFDVYTRAIARHIGKHIPGNPTAIVNYVQGASGLIAANQLYNVRSMQDGLTVGLFSGALILNQKLGAKGAQFDAAGFNWMGTPVRDSIACVLTKKSGVTTVQEWFNSSRPMKLGGVGPGTTLSVPPRVLKASLGLPIQLIEGYLGANEVKLAAEQGELDGGCWNWGSIKVMWGKGIDAGDVSVIVQANPERDPDLANVPNAIELAKTDKVRALLSAGIHAQTSMFRAYSIPPKVPADRIQALQTAFMRTMTDPDFLKDAHQAQIDITPLSGPEVKKIVSDLSKLDDAMLAELKKILLD